MKKRIFILLVISVIFPLFFLYGYRHLVRLKESAVPLPGHWNLLRHSLLKKLSEKEEKITKLTALPYLHGNAVSALNSGVTVFDKDLALDGFNLYIAGHAPEAYLMDMQGKTLYQWHYEASRVEGFKPVEQWDTHWTDIHLFENGDLIVMFTFNGIIKIDKNSKLLWAYPGEFHHNFSLDEEGNIYALTQQQVQTDEGETILDHFIAILSSGGKFIKEISIYELFKKLNDRKILQEIHLLACGVKKLPLEAFRQGDVFHANAVRIFDGKQVSRSPLFKKGNALLSIRHLGILAIVDLKTEEILWYQMPGIWKVGQHDPVFLDNGDILLFDNYFRPDESRVIEFDPLTKNIAWEYRDPKHDFFSSTQGTNQRLKNGNTLIAESRNGRAFEVTPDKKIVWEFFVPYRTGEQKEWIARLFQMIRIPANANLSWLGKSSKDPNELK